MKILITSDWYTPAVNGVVASILALRRQLEARGHEGRVLTLSGTVHTTCENGVYAVGSVDAGLIYPGARLRSFAVGQTVRRLVEWKPDVVHSQCEFSTFFLARHIARAVGAPLIHTYHTVYEDYTHYFSPSRRWGRLLARGFTRAILGSCDEVIAPTEKVRALLEGYGVKPPVTVIPTGIPLGRFAAPVSDAVLDGLRRRLGIPAENRILVSVGRLAKEKNLEELLGPRKYTRDQLSGEDTIGLVNGLAWTSVGGELLPIEVAVMEGTGKIQLTGSLGDVMKESAGAAITCIRTRAGALGISPKFYEKCDIHIHAPEGAVPKDGPSAGIAMATAITSALCGIPVRHDVAMTGEITLQGRVLPIGGLKEKSMAAYKNGIKTVLIPAENVPDLAEVDSVVKENVKFIPVKRVDAVLETALTHMPRPVTQETVVLAGDITAKHQKAPELYQ